MDPITGVIALSGITAASIAALRLKKNTEEGFEALPGGPRNAYRATVNEGQQRYNSFMAMVNPIENSLFPVGASKKVKEGKQEDIKSALGSLLAPYDPTSPEALKIKDFVNRYPIRTDDGGLFEAVRFCKEAAQNDSNPFTIFNYDRDGNKTTQIRKAGQQRDVGLTKFKFDEICGVCLTSGVDEEGKPFNGRRGMLVDPNAVESAMNEQRDYSYPFPRVNPSLGKCEGAPNSPVFAVDQETLDLYTKRMDCMKTKDINEQNGCGLCYENNTFSYVSPKVQKNTISLILLGIGKCNISVKNISIKTNILLNESTPVKIPMILNQDVWSFDNRTRRWAVQKRVSPASEGDSFTVEVTQDPSNPDEIPIIYGYMSSSNPNGGAFSMPLNLILVRDDITNSAPNRSGGFYQFPENGVEVAKIRPGGESGRDMRLVGDIPFTFVQSNEFSGIDCPTAPYQIKAKSANSFATDQPCYAKGSRPGNYNDACLRERILDVGCTNAGDLFKNPSILNRSRQGNPNNLSQIFSILREIAGNDMVEDEATRLCSGRTVASPCQFFTTKPSLKMEKILNGTDKANAKSAPVVKSCLAYIYNNKGAQETGANPPTGPTYRVGTNYSNTTSKLKDLYCLPNGQLNPESNQDALMELARIYDNGFKGAVGVDAVKNYLNNTLEVALDERRNGNTDPDRRAAIRKCFGTDFKPLTAPSNITGSPRVVPDPPRYVIRDPRGRQWRVAADNSVRLNSGQPIEMDFVARPDTFKASQARVALLVDGNPSRALRHSGFNTWLHPFVGNNLDFAWYPIRTGNTVTFYNDYADGWVLGYDESSDRVMIVPKGDSRIVNWSIVPYPTTFVRDDAAALVVPVPTIRFAWYGSRYRVTGADVTQRVVAILNSRAASIAATNGNFGDPLPGIYKALWIDFNPPGSTVLKQVVINEGHSMAFRDMNANSPNAPPIPTPPTNNLPSSFTPIFNRLIGTAQNNGDYILEMTINPRGRVGNWGSIVHFTINGRDCCAFGERMPAIWFFPNDLNLHVQIGDATNGNWGINTNSRCGLNMNNRFRLECRGQNVTVTLNSEVIQARQPTRRPVGNAQVFAADAFYQAANALITDFKFTALN